MSDLLVTAASTVVLVAYASYMRRGRVALYGALALALAAALSFVGARYAAAPLILLLAGVWPFGKWLRDLYAVSWPAGVLAGLVGVFTLSLNFMDYEPVRLLLFTLGVFTALAGVFQSMAARSFSGYGSSLHQVVYGLLLAAATGWDLVALFVYLLVPSVLGLTVVNLVHGRLGEKGSGLLEHGGLSTSMPAESVSVLTGYLVLFSLVSMGGEVFLKIGFFGDAEYLAAGCVAILVAALCLASFYRAYTMVFEGVQQTDSGAKPSGALALISAGVGLLTALTPAVSFLAYSRLGGVGFLVFEPWNLLLLVMTVAVAASLLFSSGMKGGKFKSWLGGYSSPGDLKGPRGEILSSWIGIMKPLYALGVPDEGAAEALGKLHPAILVALAAVLAALGVLL